MAVESLVAVSPEDAEPVRKVGILGTHKLTHGYGRKLIQSLDNTIEIHGGTCRQNSSQFNAVHRWAEGRELIYKE